MWYHNSIFYQISTLDFCGARIKPEQRGTLKEPENQPPIYKVARWAGYIRDMGFNAVYLCPVFSSSSHGYDTRDYRLIDPRLGTNDDFAQVVDILHQEGIRVVIDGVFNHVGREFGPFEDLLKNKENSRYKDWFFIDFNGNSPANDGFYYEGWEGHYDLVKLNTDRPEVRSYLLESVEQWIDRFHIDGLRLDVAYSVSPDFLSALRDFCKEKKKDFFLVGESLRDDYPFLLERMDSVTNYHGYKGIWSSFNDKNLFEIAHTCKRLFNQMLPGRYLFNFLDNHDVTRIASILSNSHHLYPAYGLLMALPGIPCIYYGSEWGIKGEKKQNAPDHDLRPYLDNPVSNDLSPAIRQLNLVRRGNIGLSQGDYTELYVTGEQFVFERKSGNQRIIAALNISQGEAQLDLGLSETAVIELITSQHRKISNPLILPPYSIQYLLVT